MGTCSRVCSSQIFVTDAEVGFSVGDRPSKQQATAFSGSLPRSRMLGQADLTSSCPSTAYHCLPACPKKPRDGLCLPLCSVSAFVCIDTCSFCKGVRSRKQSLTPP